PGLVILPTHRVLEGLPNFDSGRFVEGVRQAFSFEQIPGAPAAEKILTLIAERTRKSSVTVMAAVTRYGAWLMTFQPAAAQHILTGLSPRQQQLDPVILHRVVIEHMLGVSEEAVRNLENIRYFRDAQEALDRVRNGADVA